MRTAASMLAAFMSFNLVLAISSSWARVTFEAALTLPKQNAGPARAALLAATKRVNAIAAPP